MSNKRMPKKNIHSLHRGRDAKGPYYEAGAHGERYHYRANDAQSRERARKKAGKQAEAAYANGYRGH